MNPGDRYPGGYVFDLRDGRFFYADIAEASAEMRMDGIYELRNPHPDVTKTPDSSNRYKNPQPYSKLGPVDTQIRTNDTAVFKLLLEAFYDSKKARQKLKELSLA